jgi:regulator of replication initiation timing
MEDDVKSMQKELEVLQDERKNLAMVKKLLKCVEARAKQPGCLLQQQQKQLQELVKQQQLKPVRVYLVMFHVCRRSAPDSLVVMLQKDEGAGTRSTPQLSTVFPCHPPPPPPPACIMQLEQQLKELKQQYQRLKEDYNGKVCHFLLVYLNLFIIIVFGFYT